MYSRNVVLVLLGCLLGWAFHVTQPPPPKICGAPGGPPVTAPRIRLSDGRHLAYVERGVSKDVAKYKIISVHGMSASKDLILPASPELVEELGIYIVAYDRAGYGESDPNPKRSVMSEVSDIQQLADQLNLGEKFYVIGHSMGGMPVWGCLKHIPDRLAGAALIVPVINYWWPSLPSDLLKQGLGRHPIRDQFGLRLAHYVPALYSWMTKRFASLSSVADVNPAVFSPRDLQVLRKLFETGWEGQGKAIQQGEFESVHRDVLVGFGDWGFDPLNLRNPFPHNESSIYIWQGYEDRIISARLQRYVSQRLPWIKYHEVSDAGHMLPFTDNLFDLILKALLIGEEPSVI